MDWSGMWKTRIGTAAELLEVAVNPAVCSNAVLFRSPVSVLQLSLLMRLQGGKARMIKRLKGKAQQQ